MTGCGLMVCWSGDLPAVTDHPGEPQGAAAELPRGWRGHADPQPVP